MLHNGTDKKKLVELASFFNLDWDAANHPLRSDRTHLDFEREAGGFPRGGPLTRSRAGLVAPGQSLGSALLPCVFLGRKRDWPSGKTSITSLEPNRDWKRNAK